MSRDDRGDTLVEVLIAVAIVAITAAALIGTVLTSISASSDHRELALNDTVLKSYAGQVSDLVQRQQGPVYHPTGDYAFDDSTSADYIERSDGHPEYDAKITSVQCWIGGQWSSCSGPNTLQLLTATVTAPGGGVSSSLSFVVRDPR